MYIYIHICIYIYVHILGVFTCVFISMYIFMYGCILIISMNMDIHK